MNVTKIEASKKFNNKKRVAAYARVSTDSAEQLDSLKAQKEHYEMVIKNNPQYEFVGIYFDEGISGRSMAQRTSLIRLLNDCEKGYIDKIITKSISRFARNTSDCLTIIRRLTKLNIEVYFEKENINTLEMENELMLSILAGLAQSESESISENIRWGIQNRFKQGNFIISMAPYGYKKVGKTLEIDEEEAKVVKRIFKEYLSGIGTPKVAEILNKEGFKTRKGREWSDGSIRSILTNEKYVGDSILQKSYTDSSNIRHRNNGEKDKFFKANTHEAIISHDDFERVQELLKMKRVNLNLTRKPGKEYPLSGKIICGECGTKWTRTTNVTGNLKYVSYWCPTHVKDKEKCKITQIKEEYIKDAFVSMMNKLVVGRKEILLPFCKNEKYYIEEELKYEVKLIDEKIEETQLERNSLMRLLRNNYIELNQYEEKNKEFVKVEDTLNKRRTELMKQLDNDEKKQKSINDLIFHVSKREIVEEFSKEELTKFVKEIIVINNRQIKFVLQCGLNLIERW